MIEQLRVKFDVKTISETLNISRSTYYYQTAKKANSWEIENERLTQKIKNIWLESKKIYGAPKIQHKLTEAGEIVSLKRVQRLMKQADIRSIVVRKWKATPHPQPLIERENILKQDFSTTTVNQKWTTDMTYIYTIQEGWTYLSSIQDLHTKKIIAWDLGRQMTEELVLKTLKKAISQTRADLSQLIIQSDLGTQYTANAYEKLLNRYQIRHSYSRKGTPYDNACIEAFHAVLKKEEVYQKTYQTYQEANLALFQYIEGFYNSNRIHSSISYLTPLQAERLAWTA